MAELAQALRGVMPAGMALGVDDPQIAPPPLWPGEVLAAAVPKRQREFAGGRAAARQAMAGLGQRPAALPIGPDRAPVWPETLTGSISHCAGACMAVVGKRTEFSGIGLDIEPARPIEPALWPSLLTEGERQALLALPEPQRGLRVLQVFVAKEAAYKAQFALSRRLIGFHAMEIAIQGDRVTAQLVQDLLPFPSGYRLSGRLVFSDRHLAALIWIAAPPPV